MNEIGLVADDLTGALDAGHGFAERGHRTVVLAHPASDGRRSSAAAVVGYNTDGRYVDAPEAADRVERAIAALSCRRTYVKVDSTLRGNVGVSVDAALRATGAPFAVFAPAYPSQGRTTRDGVHYVDGEPIDETAYADDGKGPSSPALTTLFAALDRPVGHLPLDVLASAADGTTAASAAGTDGPAAGPVAAELAAIVDGFDAPPVVIADATAPGHLVALADALRELGASRSIAPVVAGSGGLAKHVHVPGRVPEPRAVPVAGGGAPLGVVGSTNPTTLSQLERLPSASVVPVDPSALVAGTVPEAAVARAVDRIDAGDPAVLTSATAPDAVERTLALGEDRGLAPDAVRDRVATTLGAAGVAVAGAAAVSGLVLSGGDVALATIRAADATTLSLTGAAIADGVPIGRFEDGGLAGTPVATKAGGFGGRNVLAESLAVFERDDD